MLRDAQLVVARELGSSSWDKLVEHVQARTVEGFAANGRVSRDIISRAFREADKLGHAFCSDVHVLLAVLHPDRDTSARRVLVELGADYEAARVRFRPRQGGITSDGQGVGRHPG